VKGSTITIKTCRKGNITKAARAYIRKYTGHDTDNDQVRDSHSGHPMLRYLTNTQLAILVSRTLNHAVKQEGLNITIVDVGSKWTQMIPLLDKSLRAFHAKGIYLTINYVGYRPQETTYDQLYWGENGNYQSPNPALVCTLQRGYWAPECSDNADYTWMFDSNYYLGNIHKGDLTNGMLLIRTQHFPSAPGDYRLPWNEGTFIISNGKVCMNTIGSGKNYEHPLVFTDLAGMTVESTGFYSQVYGMVPSTEFN